MALTITKAFEQWWLSNPDWPDTRAEFGTEMAKVREMIRIAKRWEMVRIEEDLDSILETHGES